MYHGQVVIEGNLTHDPEIKEIPNGNKTCRFAIASNRYYRNAERELINEVSFVTVDTWGRLAENCNRYLQKGRGVRVVGRLRQDRWQGDDDRPRERMIVVAEHVEFYPDPNRANASDGADGNGVEGEIEMTESETPEAEMVFEESASPTKKKRKR